jgi:hypothetical protein
MYEMTEIICCIGYNVGWGVLGGPDVVATVESHYLELG